MICSHSQLTLILHSWGCADNTFISSCSCRLLNEPGDWWQISGCLPWDNHGYSFYIWRYYLITFIWCADSTVLQMLNIIREGHCLSYLIHKGIFCRFYFKQYAQLISSQSVVGSDLADALFIRVALLALRDTRLRSLSNSSPEPTLLLVPSPSWSSCDPLHSSVCKSHARRGGRSWAGCKLIPGGLDGYPS